MDAIKHFAQLSMKKNAPDLRAGDTVRVHQKIREGTRERIQMFEGVVMAVRGGTAINSSFVVRRVASGVGVEKTFPLHSPNVVKVERLKTSKVRQARLYYLRTRFGRNARMRGEEWSKDAWDEPAAVEEVISNEEVTEAPVEAEDAETPVEEAQQDAPEIQAPEASETDSDDTAESAEKAESPEGETEEDK